MSDISKFYSGRDILVTGATGFLGKVLVEKLLRYCPNIRNIFLLVRLKNSDLISRKEKFLNNIIFKNIRRNQPNSLNKIILIEADLEKVEMGMCENDKNIILSSVSIIFHSAACVRFDQEIGAAVHTNVSGTRRLLQFATNLRQLDAFVYVSTSYSQTPDIFLEERYYTPPIVPEVLEKMVQTIDSDILDILTPKILGCYPNTYGFSKSCSEHIVNSFSHCMPVSVARPSIIVGALKDPSPGYTEGFHSINGWCIAIGRGVLRTLYVRNSNQSLNVIPVDIVANGLILIAFERVQKSKSNKNTIEDNQNNRRDGIVVTKPEAEFYNLTQAYEHMRPFTFLSDKMTELYPNSPFNFGIWYPGGSPKTTRVANFICVILQQIIPALLIDLLLVTSRLHKPIMCKIQRKIMYGLNMIEYYYNNDFMFKSEKIKILNEHLSDGDKEIYCLNTNTIFKNIRPNQPNSLNKIILIEADLEKVEMGMCENDKNIILSSFSIILHSAACVRFDQEIGEAVRTNVSGTRRLLQFATNLHQLDAFVYISTSYSQTPDIFLEERYYTPPIVPEVLEKMVQTIDNDILDILTPKIIGRYPNTYGFSKSCSEHIVNSYSHCMPVSVARPSIIGGALKEPSPGYTEGNHSIIGWCVAVGRGVLRTMYVRNSNQSLNIIPVDIVANALILIAYERIQNSKSNKNPIEENQNNRRDGFVVTKPEAEFYNLTQAYEHIRPFTFLSDKMTELYPNSPFNFSLWYPGGSAKTTRVANFICLILQQIIPALLIDLLLVTFRLHKPIMCKIQRKIMYGLNMIEYYYNNDFMFKTDKFEILNEHLSNGDKEIYFLNTNTYGTDDYIQNLFWGIKKYILRENESDLRRAKLFHRGLFYLDKISQLICLWCIYIYLKNAYFSDFKIPYFS